MSKLNAAGSALTYSTYLGGSGSSDSPKAIAVDAAGNAVAIGTTNSADFPVKSAFQATSAGGATEVFVSKINAAGSALVFSTYLGGSDQDAADAVALDPTGNVYVAGSTRSTNFPTKNPLATFETPDGFIDGFVTELTAAGNALVYSTYLGGTVDTEVHGLAVDQTGAATFVGSTTGNITTLDPLVPASPRGSPHDAFVGKVSAGGSSFLYATYVSGSQDDVAYGVALDSTGAAFIAGYTQSTDFLPKNGAFQSSLKGGVDSFVVKVVDDSNGAVCASDDQCGSNFCVDGICCNTACTDQCAACNVASHLGACSPATGAVVGTVRQACSKTPTCTATCDGTNTKACTYGPQVCSSTCANASESDTVCDTTGSCTGKAAHLCNNLICADDKTCKTKCAIDTDCVAGFGCAMGGTCTPGGTCSGDHATSTGADGTVQTCAPFKCDTSGTCGKNVRFHQRLHVRLRVRSNGSLRAVVGERHRLQHVERRCALHSDGVDRARSRCSHRAFASQTIVTRSRERQRVLTQRWIAAAVSLGSSRQRAPE